MYNLIVNIFPCRLIQSWSLLSHQCLQPPPTWLRIKSLDYYYYYYTVRVCHGEQESSACLACTELSLKICIIDCHFGLLCLFETYCTTCGAVLNAMLSCDRIDEEDAGNAPFIVVCTNHGQIRRQGEVLFF